jgi:hypothetical protein
MFLLLFSPFTISAMVIVPSEFNVLEYGRSLSVQNASSLLWESTFSVGENIAGRIGT